MSKIELIEKLKLNMDLSDDELREIIETNEYDEELFKSSDRVRKNYYGRDVYIRGLIEISNYCKNNCYYCGIRKDNDNVNRYRLSEQDILECCSSGYELGFRTFVLQSGEDVWYTDDKICSIVLKIKEKYPDCAITLSLGEKTYDSYKAYFGAGADRYLLRHETANESHYKRLHPNSMSIEKRKECLFNLKKIGYQVGSGFMVGSPYQKTEHLIEDIRFLQKLKPDMIGIGPYITHKSTPFNSFESGSFELTLRMVAILRLLFPNALIPATTALGTIDKKGREQGLLAGANVVMPNLSPVRVRKLYELYENKICTGEEAAECRVCLNNRVSSVGYNIVCDIGNVKKLKN